MVALGTGIPLAQVTQDSLSRSALAKDGTGVAAGGSKAE